MLLINPLLFVFHHFLNYLFHLTQAMPLNLLNCSGLDSRTCPQSSQLNVTIMGLFPSVAQLIEDFPLCSKRPIARAGALPF